MTRAKRPVDAFRIGMIVYVIAPDPMSGRRRRYTVHAISLRTKHSVIIGRELPIGHSHRIARKHADGDLL